MIKAIVTTTINKPTKALLKFIDIGARDGWDVYIVGDKKTPHDDYLKLAQEHPHVAYIHPKKQESKYGVLSELIGWNCIQRRNIGFIEAYNNGAEIMATVDDDNIPYDTWGKKLRIKRDDLSVATYETLDIVFDPMQGTDYRNNLWHRGFPVQLLSKARCTKQTGKTNPPPPLVQADLWDGEPDVDAVCRIAKGPFDVSFRRRDMFRSAKPAPFNSQNTFMHRDIFPIYFLFPHIGRMDDIWAAYVTQKYFPGSVIFGNASVYQERNDHDLTKDLEAEMFGYRNTLSFVQSLYGDGDWKQYLPPQAIAAYEAYKACFKVKSDATDEAGGAAAAEPTKAA